MLGEEEIGAEYQDQECRGSSGHQPSWLLCLNASDTGGGTACLSCASVVHLEPLLAATQFMDPAADIIWLFPPTETIFDFSSSKRTAHCRIAHPVDLSNWTLPTTGAQSWRLGRVVSLTALELSVAPTSGTTSRPRLPWYPSVQHHQPLPLPVPPSIRLRPASVIPPLP